MVCLDGDGCALTLAVGFLIFALFCGSVFFVNHVAVFGVIEESPAFAIGESFDATTFVGLVS